MDFSNRQNRFVRLDDVPTEYLHRIESLAKNDPFYPNYHIAPRHGLLNDPNGLSYFNGEHHIFYQWFPLGPVHGLKHWYHLSTKNFIHYKDHGIAMYPDQDYDQHGCYTGVAVSRDDYLYLFYTANLLDEEKNGFPSQALAVMDKKGKIEKKGVVVDFYPQAYTQEFRDPVIVERTDQVYMLIGAQDHQRKGTLACYSGSQLNKFNYLGNIDIGLINFGFMWECPNYYEEDNQGVLILSPQGISSDNRFDFKNVFSVVYLIGKPIDFENKKFTHNGYIELDKGFDFYAPQVYKDKSERRILIGWLGNSKSEYPTDKNYWAHMLTLPREIKVEQGRLIQTPIRELEVLRYRSELLENEHILLTQSFELELSITDNFSLSLMNRQGDQVCFSGTQTEFKLDRTYMTYVYAEKYGTVRYAKRLEAEQVIRIYFDRSSIEIFADNGKTVFTARIFVDGLYALNLSNTSGCIHYLNHFIFNA